MKTVIYRKSDGRHVGTIPKYGTLQSELNLNVFPNFGGTEEDYAYLVVPFDSFKLEKINSEVIAVEIEPPAPEPQPPSEIELLKQENTQLKQRLTEIDAALFDVILKTNN